MVPTLLLGASDVTQVALLMYQPLEALGSVPSTTCTRPGRTHHNPTPQEVKTG